jgi:phosphoglucomutase
MGTKTMENFSRWLNSDKVGKADKEVLQKMDDATKDAAFFKDIEFGTGGLRGILGPGTNRMNYFTVKRVTVALGIYLKEFHQHAKEKGVAISHDNRHFSREFALECSDILNQMGIKTYLFDSLRPTPELSYAVRYKKCDAGIMITASHNPKEYNGYKVYDETGCQMVPSKIEPLIRIINKLPNELEVEVPQDSIRGEQVILEKEVDDTYVSLCESIQVNKDLDKKGFKIVYTPNHGTSYVNAMRVFKDCGYEVYPVESQCKPDPNFSGTLSPNPEDARAFIEPIKLAKSIDADLICMTDPDGDRVGLACKNKDGEYTLITGNESAAILMDYLFSEKKKKGILSKDGIMFNTVVTSELGKEIAATYGIMTEQVLTGFKYIGDRINYYEIHNGPTYEFGYEESYGCLPKAFVRDKDGIQAILLYCEMALFYHKQGLNLVDVYKNLGKRYGYHKNKLYNIYLEGSKGAQKMQEIMNKAIHDPLKQIGGEDVIKFEDYFDRKRYFRATNLVEDIQGIPAGDLVKYYLADKTVVCIRPSGTEPKIKFYIEVVVDDPESAEDRCDQIYNEVLKDLDVNL